MPEERTQPVDFWEELDAAEATVTRWPAWQRGYDAEVALLSESSSSRE